MMTRFLLQQNASRRKKEMRYFDDKYVPRSRTDEINIFLKIFLDVAREFYKNTYYLSWKRNITINLRSDYNFGETNWPPL